MPSIQPIGPRPSAAPAPIAVPSAPALQGPSISADAGVASRPISVANANYNWNYANPREHIFDHPYDGWALNRGFVGLFPLGFWTRFAPMRSLASMFTRIPEQRLHAYAVRQRFMQVPGMVPDYARVLQLGYFNATNGQMPMRRNMPLSWLGQYAAPGDVNDWVLRGPFLLSLHTTAVQQAFVTGYTPSVPGNRELAGLAQQALMIAPPMAHPGAPGYGGMPGYGAPGGYPGAPGYGGMPGYGADPITQIGGLIGAIGNLFR